jgi:hypothetical protein
MVFIYIMDFKLYHLGIEIFILINFIHDFCFWFTIVNLRNRNWIWEDKLSELDYNNEIKDPEQGMWKIWIMNEAFDIHSAHDWAAFRHSASPTSLT